MNVFGTYEFSYRDDRGVLQQLISSTKGFKQINRATTIKDAVRVGHYHKTATETFYLIRGRIKVHVMNIGSGREYTKFFEAGDMFQIEPLEKHTVTALEDSEWLAFFDQNINDGDTFRE